MIYLDNNATTQLDPDVAQLMIDELKIPQANPSSLHSLGQKAQSKLLAAREKVARILNVNRNEIIFTSGGTEGVNLLMRGYLPQNDGHIITTNIEHASMYNTALDMQTKGAQVTFIPVNESGAPNPQIIAQSICPQTRLIALSAVNSETGVITDIHQIASIAEQYKIPFIVDGVALLGKKFFSIPKGVSAMVFSSHKIHGPQGCGFCYLNNHSSFSSPITGGPQEYNKRAGTENLISILATAFALEKAYKSFPKSIERMEQLRNLLEALIRKTSPIIINGSSSRICNTTNIAFPSIDAESFLIYLSEHGVAASHGAACSSGALEPSRVLLNMGIDLSLARNSLRFSLSRMTTEEEIHRAAAIISKGIISFKKIHIDQ